MRATFGALVILVLAGCGGASQPPSPPRARPQPESPRRGCPEGLGLEAVQRFELGLSRFVSGDGELETRFFEDVHPRSEALLADEVVQELGLAPLDTTPLWLLAADHPPCRLTERRYALVQDANGAVAVHAALDGECGLSHGVGFVVRALEEPSTCRLGVVDTSRDSEYDETPSLPEILAPLAGRDLCSEPGCVVRWRIRRATIDRVHLLSFSAQEVLEVETEECGGGYGHEASGTFVTFGDGGELAPPPLTRADNRYVMFARDHRGLIAVVPSDLVYGYDMYLVDARRPPDQWTHRSYAWSWRVGDEPHPDRFFYGCDP